MSYLQNKRNTPHPSLKQSVKVTMGHKGAETSPTYSRRLQHHYHYPQMHNAERHARSNLDIENWHEIYQKRSYSAYLRPWAVPGHDQGKVITQRGTIINPRHIEVALHEELEGVRGIIQRLISA